MVKVVGKEGGEQGPVAGGPVACRMIKTAGGLKVAAWETKASPTPGVREGFLK